jgi:hypothetical protein
MPDPQYVALHEVGKKDGGVFHVNLADWDVQREVAWYDAPSGGIL